MGDELVEDGVESEQAVKGNLVSEIAGGDGVFTCSAVA